MCLSFCFCLCVCVFFFIVYSFICHFLSLLLFLLFLLLFFYLLFLRVFHNNRVLLKKDAERRVSAPSVLLSFATEEGLDTIDFCCFFLLFFARAFPKRPRSFDFALPTQIRRLGLAHALSAKVNSKSHNLFVCLFCLFCLFCFVCFFPHFFLKIKAQSGKLVLVDKANEVSGKAGDLAALVDRMNWRSVLVVTGDKESDPSVCSHFVLVS